MKLKIPHMGWNSITPVKVSCLNEGIQPPDLVYFVHSYYVTCSNPNDVIFKTEYGIDFDSAFQHEDIIGLSTSSRKSHKTGLQLLRNFINL